MKMKEIQRKLDYLFTKAGQYNKYQFIIVTLFFFQFICSQFFHNNFPYLIARPFIEINNKEIRIDPYICKEFFNEKNSTDSIILRKKQIPTTSIILDFKLYCEHTKTYLISISYYLGIIISSFISYNFYDKVGTKLTLSIFIPCQNICLILFQFLNFGFLENNLYFLYGNLFFLGMSEYIIINILFLYICDIIKVSDVPLFMTVIISGRPLSFLLGIFFFNFLHLNWKTDLAIMSSVDIIIFILILTFMINSPKAALRNNQYVQFTKYLYQIGIKNGKILSKEDFDFLLPYMTKKEIIEYENIFIDRPINVKRIYKIDNTNITNDNKILNEGLIINNIDAIYTNTNDEREEYNLKDDYLLSDNNNKVGSIQTLINKTKMHDYSPLDLFRFKSHFINFCILCFLWAVYNFIKYGLDSTAKEIPEYNNNIIWVIGTHIIGVISLYIIMLLYISNKSAFHRLLIIIELITFITLLFAVHLDNVAVNKNIYIFSIVIAQICWNCLYLLLILITLLIYPIMMRSKGLGWNIAFGTVGKLVVMFLVDLSNEHEYILYFMVFDFLLLVFSYGLPKRIGSFVLELNDYEEKNKKEFEDIENENDDENVDIAESINRKLSF